VSYFSFCCFCFVVLVCNWPVLFKCLFWLSFQRDST